MVGSTVTQGTPKVCERQSPEPRLLKPWLQLGTQTTWPYSVHRDCQALQPLTRCAQQPGPCARHRIRLRARVFPFPLIWALGLIGCALSPDLLCMTLFRAVNGIGLGIVQPLFFSLVADKSSTYGRGKAFGGLIFTGQLGQTAFATFATVAGKQVASIAGWQFALLVIAILRAFVGIGVGMFVKETKERDQRAMLEVILQETPKLGKICCLPTFLMIVGQGIFGTALWFAFSYLRMWLEQSFFFYAAGRNHLCFLQH